MIGVQEKLFTLFRLSQHYCQSEELKYFESEWCSQNRYTSHVKRQKTRMQHVGNDESCRPCVDAYVCNLIFCVRILQTSAELCSILYCAPVGSSASLHAPSASKRPAAVLQRPFLAYTLYDRLSTRPFLACIEKKWIAFQLLKALDAAHRIGVSFLHPSPTPTLTYSSLISPRRIHFLSALTIVLTRRCRDQGTFWQHSLCQLEKSYHLSQPVHVH